MGEETPSVNERGSCRPRDHPSWISAADDARHAHNKDGSARITGAFQKWHLAPTCQHTDAQRGWVAGDNSLLYLTAFCLDRIHYQPPSQAKKMTSHRP
ncbi:unnamed protein product [Boreogadus saida]